MRSFFWLALLITLAFAGVNWYTKTVGVCPVPLYYSLGTIDERFSISKEELKVVSLAAEELWEKAIGDENLFVYDETSEFKINFIYDERQKMASTEEEWRIRLDEQQTKHEELLLLIKELGDRYQIEEASYINKRKEYESMLSSYNARVEQFNQEGGVSKEVYSALQVEAKELNTKQQEIISLEESINDLADTINQYGESGNQNIADYNAEVLEYNKTFGTLETFTQGDYGRERINIYKFADTKELQHVIAHEFGHALGIPHVEGEQSVMYYLMTERDSSLSEQDIAALKAVCGNSQTFGSRLRKVIRDVLTRLNLN